jgi:carbon monoxide dehydrogenase subunit G
LPRLADVWPRLRDPSTVVTCIPGAQLAPDQNDGVSRGSIRVKFGPVAAVFRGEATLVLDDAAHRCTIEGRGIDQRGASRALSTGTIEAADEGAETVLTVQGAFTVTGPLETFANAGGVHLARALLADFAANMAKLVQERRARSTLGSAPASELTNSPDGAIPAAASASPPSPSTKHELSASRLLWQGFLSWLRSLFSGRAR